jgi:hypothetical protein
MPACRQGAILSSAENDSTNNSLNSRLRCVAPPGGLRNICVAFPGFGEAIPEALLPTGYAAAVSVEYPSGSFTRLTFDGKDGVEISPGLTLQFSDLADLEIPGGAVFYIKTYAKWVAGNFWLAQQVASSLADEWTNRGTDLADHTLSSAVLPSTDWSGLAPSIFTADLLPPAALGIIGDSIAFGSDVPSPIDASKFIDRAMRNQIPAINLARNGDFFRAYVAQPAGREQLLLGHVTSLICQYGLNDISGGTPLEAMKARAQAAWARYLTAGIKVWQTTITPRTTSTDNWATTANQKLVNPAPEAVRQEFNGWIRENYRALGLSGYLDFAHAVDPGDSGLWNVDGVAGAGAAGFCSLAAGKVSACNLARYAHNASSHGENYPPNAVIPCVVYGYPGETGALPRIVANSNDRGRIAGFEIVETGSGLLYPPMVSPQGQWTADGTHLAPRGANAIIASTGLAPGMFGAP